MADPSHRVEITVAIIGVAGTLGAALIANWDNVSTQNPQPSVVDEQPTYKPTSVETPTPPPIPNIDGIWRDSKYPNIVSKVTQNHSTFEFYRRGSLPNGVRFESSGTGTIAGSRVTSRYNAQYETGEISTGECNGSVSSDTSRIQLNCTDSFLGPFASNAERE